MSIILSTPAQPRTYGTWARIGRISRALRAHEDRVHLHALSDHMLNDMGFLRDQIDDVLRGVVRRP
ncbi:DUF1127 domain-containing protein [Rubellimicrobium arenae]|uniref:DUF1127 domain-containing protein n=1 Tax=Rubellimicrobium arenae TaxID=2817372 RepID=UPI001B304306|nr:DUF1127 domain-containing protein [Rubellimicrobium arenae]